MCALLLKCLDLGHLRSFELTCYRSVTKTLQKRGVNNTLQALPMLYVFRVAVLCALNLKSTSYNKTSNIISDTAKTVILSSEGFCHRMLYPTNRTRGITERVGRYRESFGSLLRARRQETASWPSLRPEPMKYLMNPWSVKNTTPCGRP